MTILENIKHDIQTIKDRDPAATSTLEILTYSGLHAVAFYRVSHWFYVHKHKVIARCISQFARMLTGIEIHPGAKIGKGLLIDHGSGVVIGETAEIGDYCLLYQGCTLGGTGKDQKTPDPWKQCYGRVRCKGAWTIHCGGQCKDSRKCGSS